MHVQLHKGKGALITLLLLSRMLLAQAHITITLDPVQQPGTVSGYSVSDPVAVSVAPLLPSVASGGAQQFTATVQYAQNATVQWTASAGVIDSDGLFTAPSLSVDTPVTITATSVADVTRSASTVVTVKAAASVVVAVSPKTASLVAGGTAQFTATVTGTANGAISWTAVGGVVDSNGLFTAGGTAGAGSVTAV